MRKIAFNARTKEEVREVVEKLGYELLNEYKDENNRRKRVVIQDFYGYKYDIQLNDLMRSNSPRFVQKNNPFVLENISLWLEIENKPFVLCENNKYDKTSKKLLFQCLREDCQEIFDMSWNEVYSMGSGCPFCVGKRAGKNNNLASLMPNLVKEWDYTKNENNPESYTKFSHKKVSWICSKCNHSWDAVIGYRSKGAGCPKCADTHKESKIANELKIYLIDNYNAKDEHRVFKNPETGNWLPYDIYIPYGKNIELNGFYIEVHWNQHYELSSFHKTQAKRSHKTPEEEFEYQKHLDRLKRRFARKNGIYIEIDLRKIKTTEKAIEYIEEILRKFLNDG